MWKKFISQYLNFSKRDRNGIIVLLSLVVVIKALPYFYPLFITTEKYDPSEYQRELALLKERQTDSADDTGKTYKPGKYQYQNTSYESNAANSVAKAELFYFDPNTATTDDWKRLGIRDKTIQTIQKYTSKGGKFYKPEDIGKIWGLHPDEIKRLMPYVQIKNSNAVFAEYKTGEFKEPDRKVYEKPVAAIITIDLNDTDTTALIKLPGIGSKLSKRIVNFRDKLGGFYSVDQVGETFGLPDSTFQKIRAQLRLGSTVLHQININTASLDELKGHPYLRYTLANAIVQYRSQHGDFSSVADLKKIMTITEDAFNKVAPYLKVN